MLPSQYLERTLDAASRNQSRLQLSVILLALCLIFATSEMPDRNNVPTHWNPVLRITTWLSNIRGTLLCPIVVLGAVSVYTGIRLCLQMRDVRKTLGDDAVDEAQMKRLRSSMTAGIPAYAESLEAFRRHKRLKITGWIFVVLFMLCAIAFLMFN